MAARQTRPFRLAFVVLTVSALLLASLPGPAPRPAQAKESPVDVYASVMHVDLDGSTLTALDPKTLADLTGRPVIDSGDGGRIVTISADGSTFVFGGRDGIVVRAGLDGPERMRIKLKGLSSDIDLSRDGARLVAATYVGDATETGYLYPTEWKVFDTTTGDQIATVENREGRNAYGDFVVDVGAPRLYRLVFPRGDAYVAEYAGARSALLIAYDLTTGAELGRLDLPEVIASGWWTDSPPAKELNPAIALSADGRSLAIAHADEDAVTVVDAQRLAVERTLALTRPTSRLQRLLSWIPLLPQGVAAKTAAGTLLDGVFAPDGTHLYLYGAAWGDEENGQSQYHAIGLRVINLGTGEIEADVLDGAQILQVVPSPDGRSVYLTGIKSDGRRSIPAVWRLNGKTGDIGAERSFRDRVPIIYLLPRRSRS